MKSFLRPLAEGRTYRATAHLLLGLPLGVLWFTVVVTGASLGLGMLITLLGIPILVATLLLVRLSGRLERARARALLDVALPEPPALDRTGSNWWWRGLRELVTNSLTWRTFAYDLLLLPLGIFSFTVAVTFWATSLGAVSLPIWGWSIPGDGVPLFGDGEGGSGWHGWRVDEVWEYGVVVAAGLILLAITPWVIRGLAAMEGAIVRGLLGPGRRQLDEKVRTLQAARTQSADTAAQDRRRIERDLHDGAQQRLVALAMDLGMARDKLEQGGDAEEVAELVTVAHEASKLAIKELRDLARGIHPAVLTDRGLDAALSAVAAQSPVPVDIHVDVPVRPSPAVESIAYFVVAESLTNITKHSGAHRASVQVVRHPDHLEVRVTDDGEGGADPSRGTGLRGLADRVRTVDGRFEVSSPAGGPTVVRAELPCEP
jgi:signal transduction histidine kinase